MYNFSPETLKLFATHQFSLSSHLDEICDPSDRAEIDRVRAEFKAKSDLRRACEWCKQSMEKFQLVCSMHYHYYQNMGFKCCWTCYVATVCEEQLGIHLEWKSL
jgi:hypothetical protein